jgi:acetyl-CoA acetyltransferase
MSDDELRTLDQVLHQLAALRERYNDRIGALANTIQKTEGWRQFGFASFADYCEQRFGMDAPYVERLAARARKRARRLRNAGVRGREVAAVDTKHSDQ